jgi:hypothetical protein
MTTLSRGLRLHLLLTDLGFLAYWTATAFAWLPSSLLFKDYHDPMMVAWNVSFAPLDLLASVFGLVAVAGAARGLRAWPRFALVSLVLTACAGLMAIAFWTLRRDFDPTWWLPNLYLLLWPLRYLPALLRGQDATGIARPPLASPSRLSSLGACLCGRA